MSKQLWRIVVVLLLTIANLWSALNPAAAVNPSSASRPSSSQRPAVYTYDERMGSEETDVRLSPGLASSGFAPDIQVLLFQVAPAAGAGTTASEFVATKALPDPVAEAQAAAAKIRAGGGKTPTMTSAAVDSSTGKVYTGTSGYNGSVPPEINLPNPSKTPWSAANCAEVAACSAAIADGAKLENLQVATVRTRTGVVAPPCPNCQTWVPGRKP